MSWRVRGLVAALLVGALACSSKDTPTQPAGRAPSAPRNVVATAGDAQATVSWDAPQDDGGMPIMTYRVSAVGTTIATTVNAPATTATITGLTNGTAYTFAVAATNAVGESPASSPSAAVTPRGTVVQPPPAGTRWVSGYYAGYQRSLYPESSVDMTLLTHIIVARVSPTTSGGVTTTFDIDATNGPAMARTLSTRAHQAGRKAILMVGGAGDHAGWVGAASAANRATFVNNLLKAMDDYGFDGLDLDWEPIDNADQPNLLALAKALRAARPAILLTVPVGWVSSNFPGDVTSWYADLAAQVDQVNLMTYDMAGNWGGWVSWHSSALFGEGSNHPSSVASSIAAYRAVGVPAAKLGIGLGFYGQCWRGPTAPLQTLAAGQDVVASDNAMSYTNIMAGYYSAAAAHWDDVAKVPYLSFAAQTGAQGCTYVTYEDARSIGEKAAWVNAQGLGGAIVWTINQGYLPSAAAGQRDPLLRALYTGLNP